MSTFTDLTDRAQNALSDTGAGTWSESVVQEWLIDAIRDYSRHFPRTIRHDISSVADQHNYDLPDDFKEIISVEYPQGEDPPEYLLQHSHQRDEFWESDDYYDVIFRGDATDASELIISDDVDANETIRVEYAGDHDLDLAGADTVSVPDRHHDLLIAYVIWAAWRELASSEMQAPTSNSSLLMGQLFSNAGSAEFDYRNMIRYALAAEGGDSDRVIWQMDKWDRAY